MPWSLNIRILPEEAEEPGHVREILHFRTAMCFFLSGIARDLHRPVFQYQDWARGSYTILNDIDENELKKPSLHVSLPVCGDAGDLIRKLICAAKLRGADETNPLFKGRDWIRQCQVWKQKYPVVTAKHYETVEEGCTNIYAFYEELSKAMQEGQTLMVSVGTSRVAGRSGISGKKKVSVLLQIQILRLWDSVSRQRPESVSHSPENQ